MPISKIPEENTRFNNISDAVQSTKMAHSTTAQRVVRNINLDLTLQLLLLNIMMLSKLYCR